MGVEFLFYFWPESTLNFDKERNNKTIAIYVKEDRF